jgi:hypothetical protein
MDAPADDDALLAEEALLLVVANAQAMRAVGAAISVPQLPPTQLVDADVAPTPGAAALLRTLHASLAGAKAAGDVARGRARVAPVCRFLRAAADAPASSSLLPHVVVHARSLACAAIYTELGRNTAALCGGAPALARLCAAAAPPTLERKKTATRGCSGSAGPDSDSDTDSDGDAADGAAAWRTLARAVADAAPSVVSAAAAELSNMLSEGEDEPLSIQRLVGALAAAMAYAFVERGVVGGVHAKQLRLIGATAEEMVAGKALCS